MFKVNDYIFYGTNGVCKVLDIGIPNLNLPNKKKQYYTLKQIYGEKNTIYTPIDNNKIFMRKLISKKEAAELIDNIPSTELLYAEDDKMLEEKYKEVMNKCDCKEWLKIIKTTHVRRNIRLAEGKKCKSKDDKYLEKAEEYLFEEFATVFNMNKENIKDFIMQHIKNMQNKKVTYERGYNI